MTVYTDERGTAWYVNIIDLAEVPSPGRGIISQWVDTDMPEWNRGGKVDDAYHPIRADDEEQLEARKELLRDGELTKEVNVRVYARRSGLFRH